MRRFLLLLLLITCALPLTSQAQDTPAQLPITLTDATGQTVTIESLDAIVSGSGDVTEIIYGLGFGDNLIGVDATSTYPPEALDTLPSVGFGRRLSAEPILALAPTVFFCSQTCGPSEVLEQIRAAGIPVVIVPDNEDIAGLDLPFLKIAMVAEALGVPERGAALAEQLRLEIGWVATALSNVGEPPAVFHFYIRGRGLQLAAGEGTPADAMIRGAGGYNTALDAGVTGYRPLTPEIILSAYPDYLLLTDGNVEASGGLESILDVQGLAETPAVQNGDIIVMDTQLLLGMSLRTGAALMDLARQFHPDMTWEAAPAYPYTVTDAGGVEVTIDTPSAILAEGDDLTALVQALGFLTVTDSPSLVLTTSAESAATWREAGVTVLQVADVEDIAAVAGLLNVPGRGAALLAQRNAEG